MQPSAAHFLRYRTLVRNLVFKDLKLKYRDSVLGVVWSLLNPALLLIVYTVAFKVVLRVQTENYPYFLLAALCRGPSSRARSRPRRSPSRAMRT